MSRTPSELLITKNHIFGPGQKLIFGFRKRPYAVTEITQIHGVIRYWVNDKLVNTQDEWFTELTAEQKEIFIWNMENL